MSNLFYRLDSDGNAVILDGEGMACCRIGEADGGCSVYPIGESLSCAYEHARGIVLTVEDAQKLGIPSEF